ncbi:TPA: V-type ATP synthase subunit I [Clostridioides difficile]|nr:V-type ATP synthase subunit I [Clostridioides difficile]
MAIVNMNKISIVGLEAQKSQILKLLMNRGFVQIDDSAFLTEEEELKNYLVKDSEESEVIMLEQKMSHVNQAINIVSSLVKQKKSLLALKREFNKIDSEKEGQVYAEALELNNLHKEIGTIRSNINLLNNNKSMLEPWVNFDIPLENMETKYTKTILGTVPISANIDALRVKLEDEIPESVIGIVNSDKLMNYVYLITLKETFDDVLEVLKEFNFSVVSLPNEEGTPLQAIKKYNEMIIRQENVSKDKTEEIKRHADSIHMLENLYDFYTIERDQKKIIERLVKTKTTFCLNGWLPSKRADELIKEITEKFDCCVQTEEGSKEEGFPILLENNKLVTPFESVTNMYSYPSTKDIDPNTILTFFFVVFFGMMLSDAAYGLIIAVVCGFVVYKLKIQKGEGNLIKLIGICGVSTTVWGLIFGGILGDLIPIKALINPLEDVMTLMGMSLLFGIIHIYVGLGIKAYTLIRSGKVIDAIFDIGFWYLCITGVCLLIIPFVAGDIGVFSEVGKYLAIIGAIGLVLTQGRSFKGIPVKLFKGFLSLYGITSYFADILSYTRIMALCLTTGVIAQVINLLGAIAGPILAVVIGVVGHTINLLINALGAYVHTSRLQYVEFFNKFYEGGGVPFVPFKYKTKYTSINKKEM